MIQAKMHQRRNSWFDMPTALSFLLFITGSVLGGLLVCYVEWNHDFSGSAPILTWHSASFQSLLVHNFKFLFLLYLAAFLSCGAVLVPVIWGVEGCFTGCLLVRNMIMGLPAWTSAWILVHLLLVIPYGFVLGHWSIRRNLGGMESHVDLVWVSILLMTAIVVIACSFAQYQVIQIVAKVYS